nr:prephenate dehydrogenase/arogenate dehydrogenase family protein [Bifidobacterium sp. SO4]
MAAHREREKGTVVVDTVGIVGLGLIGGSLARRLARRGIRVVAWNHRPHPYAQAEADGIYCKSTLAELMTAEPDVLVLCNPLKAMPAILAELKPLFDEHPDTTLTDVGSVKGMVRDQVKAAGLANRYVGAHPMAGNELSGWQAADPSLYDDALWAVTVDEPTDYRRFFAVASLITEDVGNRIIVLDDETHDKAAAMISHMPHVVSTALINELTANPDRNVAAALAAGCWRDMTRVALTDPDRTRAMVEEDALNVEVLLRRMAARLTDMADQLHAEQERGAGAQGILQQNRAAADVRRFFAAGDPFRKYKAALASTADFPARELEIPETGWQQTLLFSARRGEAITSFIHPHQAVIQIRPAI